MLALFNYFREIEVKTLVILCFITAGNIISSETMGKKDEVKRYLQLNLQYLLFKRNRHLKSEIKNLIQDLLRFYNETIYFNLKMEIINL